MSAARSKIRSRVISPLRSVLPLSIAIARSPCLLLGHMLLDSIERSCFFKSTIVLFRGGTPMLDAIVVGGRAAGASLGMLLARQGRKVLILDRATFPSDTLSTHFFWPR